MIPRRAFRRHTPCPYTLFQVLFCQISIGLPLVHTLYSNKFNTS